MEEKKELVNYMKKKTMEARGETSVETDGEEDKLTDAPRSINQEAAVGDTGSARVLTIFRIILNFVIVIPIVVVTIILIGYILLKFLPAALYFIRQFFLILIKAQ